MNPAEKRLRDAALEGAWYAPFYLPPLSFIKYRESNAIPTMGVKEDGTFLYNPQFVMSLAVKELEGCIFHELTHLLARHPARRFERDPMLWNIACDYTINELLKRAGIALPPDCLYPTPDLENLSAESVYDRIKDDPKHQKMAAQLRAMGAGVRVGAGCGVEPGEGQAGQEGGSGEGNPDWGRIAAASKAAAAGTAIGNVLARTLDARPAGVRWEVFLRGVVSRALAEHGRDEQTWTRRNRRAPIGLILPGWKAVRARVAVAVDTSGSVSDQMLARALDQINAMARIADSRIYLVTHDAGVQWKGWLDGRSRANASRTFTGRGGTIFEPAYEAVAEIKASFDSFIHLTDGQIGSWPEKPKNCRRMVAAIYGGGSEVPGFMNPPKGSQLVKVEV